MFLYFVNSKIDYNLYNEIQKRVYMDDTNNPMLSLPISTNYSYLFTCNNSDELNDKINSSNIINIDSINKFNVYNGDNDVTSIFICTTGVQKIGIERIFIVASTSRVRAEKLVTNLLYDKQDYYSKVLINYWIGRYFNILYTIPIEEYIPDSVLTYYDCVSDTQ